MNSLQRLRGARSRLQFRPRHSALAGSLVATAALLCSPLCEAPATAAPSTATAPAVGSATDGLGTPSDADRAPKARPLDKTPIEASLKGLFVPGKPVNDPTCRPDRDHPYPVIFIHGTASNANDWKKAAERLYEDGFCTWAFNYGKQDTSIPTAIPGLYGNADINRNADELARMVDYVRQQTGAKKVNLVGHSQGGTLTKMYLQDRGGADKVDRVVALSGTFHGTTLGGMAEGLRPIIDATPGFAAFFASTAATQQVVGSKEITHLNTLPDTDPRVMYTSVYTPADKTATPNSTSILKPSPGADVANVNISEACHPKPEIAHLNMPKHANSIDLIRWGLTRAKGDTTPSSADC